MTRGVAAGWRRGRAWRARCGWATCLGPAALAFGLLAPGASLAQASAAEAANAADPTDSGDFARRGPLFVRSRAPVWDARSAYQPGPIAVLPRGASEVRLHASHVNVWAQMPGYFWDGEWSRLQLHWRVGVGAATELTLDTGLLGRSGGRLDAPIEAFHRAFGITQARRERYPRNRLSVARRAADGAWHDELPGSDAGVGVARPTLGARHTLWQGDSGRALVAELGLGLPLGDVGRAFASGGAGLSGGVGLTAPLGRHAAFHAAFGANVRLFGGRLYNFAPSLVQKYLLAALSYAASRRIEVVLQYLNQDGAIEAARYAPLDKTTHEFALGVRALLGPRWSVEAAVIENSVHDANTPDVGIMLGVARRADG